MAGMHTRLLLSLLAAGLAWSGELYGAEVLDNEKLVKMLEAGLALQVIKPKISSSECQLSSDTDQLINISTAAKKGGMPQAEINELQQIVIQEADKDKKRLKELVVRHMNVCVNYDPQAPQEYESSLRTVLREGKATVPYLLAHFEEENERKRTGALEALERIGDKADNVVRYVRLMLNDRDRKVREQAAKTLAALAGPKTQEDLIASLERPSGPLDGVAAALGHLGDLKAVAPLTTVLKQSTDGPSRQAAANALGLLRAKDPQAIAALLAAVLDDKDLVLRAEAAKALGLIGEPQAVSHIITAYRRFRNGREQIIRSLSYFRAQDSIKFLIECVNEDSPEVRKAANESLKLLTGENYEQADEWEAWWGINKDRPDWIRADVPKTSASPVRAQPK